MTNTCPDQSVAQTPLDDEALNDSSAAAMMDIDSALLESARESGRIIALRQEDGSFLYPRWQFRYDGQPYWDIANVLEALNLDHALANRFMPQNHAELSGRTGADYIRISRSEDLGDLAARWFEAMERERA